METNQTEITVRFFFVTLQGKFLNENRMEAYEFNTIVQNGVIRIPKQLSDKNISYVKVILLSDKKSHTVAPGRKKFSAMRLKTKGFTFNREEMHER
jgi:hypothetical protein